MNKGERIAKHLFLSARVRDICLYISLLSLHDYDVKTPKGVFT